MGEEVWKLVWSVSEWSEYCKDIELILKLLRQWTHPHKSVLTYLNFLKHLKSYKWTIKVLNRLDQDIKILNQVRH